jgi:hypothetical protein
MEQYQNIHLTILSLRGGDRRRGNLYSHPACYWRLPRSARNDRTSSVLSGEDPKCITIDKKDRKKLHRIL